MVSMMYSMVSMWEEGSFSSHQAEEYESLKMIELHPGVLLRHMCNGNRSVGALWALTSGLPAWTPDPPDQAVTGPPTRTLTLTPRTQPEGLDFVLCGTYLWIVCYSLDKYAIYTIYI